MLRELECEAMQKKKHTHKYTRIYLSYIWSQSEIRHFNPANRVAIFLEVSKRFRFSKKTYFNSLNLKGTFFWTFFVEWYLKRPPTSSPPTPLNNPLQTSAPHFVTPLLSTQYLSSTSNQAEVFFPVLFCAPVGNTILIALIITLIRSLFYLSPISRLSTLV